MKIVMNKNELMRAVAQWFNDGNSRIDMVDAISPENVAFEIGDVTNESPDIRAVVTLVDKPKQT